MTPVGNCEAASQDNISNLKLMRGCELIGWSGAAEAPVRISKRQLRGPPEQALRRRSSPGDGIIVLFLLEKLLWNNYWYSSIG